MTFLKEISNNLVITSPTTLEWQHKTYRCRTGKGGIRQDKTEGDGCTPTGTFPLRKILYRPDRIRPFVTSLPLETISKVDGWCDDPIDIAYNQPVKLPYAGCHEVLWREDSVYDMLIVVGHNDDPPIPSKGSAIFIHLVNELETQTGGCIALYRKDFIKIIQEISPESCLIISDDLDNYLSFSSRNSA